jgi:hypothetical protein
VAPKYSYINRNYNGHETTNASRDHEDLRTLAITNSQTRSIPAGHPSRTPEQEPLTQGRLGNSYGSIVDSPPDREARSSTDKRGPPPSLKLPGAALDPEHSSPHVGPSKPKTATLPDARPYTHNAFEVGKTRSPTKAHTSLPARYRSIFSPKRMNSDAGPVTQTKMRPSVRRLFSLSAASPQANPSDVPLEAYRDLDLRQAEFFSFLDLQLDTIEDFYKEKEEEATHRLAVLRDQLHIMRDRRIDEVIRRQTAKIKSKKKKKHSAVPLLSNDPSNSSGDENSDDTKTNGDATSKSWLNPIDAALDAINAGKYGRSTKEITQLATPTALKPQHTPDGRRDFARRPDLPDVPYQTAKRKLKVALQEYYRGLELLKSYALLNRTAFRKINKKYDKVVNARPSTRYMSEKVDQAWFVNSNVIEGHIRSVEDLYARYFERGNHKVAVGKLRVKIARAGDYTDNTFRNGMLLAAGVILGVEGLVHAINILNSPVDPTSLLNHTSYLLQVSHAHLS